MQTLALFDLDHTLIPVDSDHAWGDFVIQIGWADPVEFRRTNEQFFEDYKRGQLDVDEYVRFNTTALRTHPAAKTSAARERFMQEIIEPAIHPEAEELVAGHKAQGHRTIIITATNEWITAPIAKRFGVDELIGIKLVHDGDKYTGEIDGTPSFQKGKVTRIQQWLAANDLTRDQVRIVFYSDSHNDLALLEFADEAIATNPDDQLRAIAVERQWRILDLFDDLR